MKVLVLGNDGRAHALVWKLFNSPQIEQVVCAPGNGGTGQLAPAVDLGLQDAAGIASWAFAEDFELILPASSLPLQAGVVDEVISLHVGVCGPALRTARLESSRCAAREFLDRYQLPTPPGRAFTDLAIAEKYLATQSLPVILKADHPANGEAIYTDRHAALVGLREMFSGQAAELPNQGVVIESYLSGPRVVFSAFTDGHTTVPLLPVRLYDRVESDDQGPVAVGVGAHTSNSRYSQLLGEFFQQRLIEPIAAGLAKEGLPFWGILGVDTIITSTGPRITALRWSFREGEAQVLLPRLEDDLLPWVQAMITQRLHELPAPRWNTTPTVGIGVLAQGYPRSFSVGHPIQGFDSIDEGVLVFHSETESPAAFQYTPKASASRFTIAGFGLLNTTIPSLTRTTGGHVLMVVAQGATLAGARARALVNVDRLSFEGLTYRDTIGAKEFA